MVRFFAALYVLLFHYGFRAHVAEIEGPYFDDATGFFQYGYLGVDLFFIVSGFVILMSAQKSNVVDFAISRVSRLYPAYWVCVLLTVFVIIAYGNELFAITWPQVMANMTMLNGFMRIPHVDGVYWSLLVELKFYFLMGSLLFIRKMKYVELLALGLLSISVLQLAWPYANAPRVVQLLYALTFPDWNSYFVAGMFMFIIWQNRKISWHMVFIPVCLGLSLIYSLGRGVVLSEHYDTEFLQWPIVVMVTLSYLVMLLIALNKLEFINKRSFLKLGVLTYPLYLIHQNIGYIAMDMFGGIINKWILLAILTIIMSLLAYVISKYIEKPFGLYLRNTLKSHKLLNRLKAKIA
ncbi:acyltransferase family protein [Allomuricauda sp. SCSIO 65647]|uniref:acyltransferase family protein n=1 Tax=Allomuricauda sp. SCSIO 65647 TaxID=2908843 RepID=UPI001F27E779|nr:acyltransferase [Muricauda sp. SCSIO 65647]UJH67020.1 acyltransferase [Muricauda sp. SCSIO 65647]